MKTYVLLALLISLTTEAICQNKTEHIGIDWPAEYSWKIAKQTNDSSEGSLVIIPGNENNNNVSIIGTMVAYFGVLNSNFDSVVNGYRKALDVGSTLTVVESQKPKNPHWVIFKIETPKNAKYPEPESDLYYVVQGKYALYSNWVAIKEKFLSNDFVDKWSKIFKSSKIIIE